MSGKSERLGWLGWLAIYAAIILLPLRFGFDIMKNISSERLAKTRDERGVWLERTSRPFFAEFNAGEVFWKYFEDAAWARVGSNSRLLEIQRRFPGSFRLHIFSENGESRPVPESLRFPDSEELHLFSRTFLARGIQGITHFKKITQADPSCPEARCISKFLGNGWQPDAILANMGRTVEGERNGKPITAYWIRFSGLPDSSPSPVASVQPAGVYLEFDPEKVPRSFFFELALRGYTKRLPSSIRTLALIDLEHPEKSFLQRGLPRNPAFRAHLRIAAEMRSGRPFAFGTWHGLTLSVDIEPSKRLCLLENLTAPIRSERIFLDRVRGGFMLLAGLGAIALLLFRHGVGDSISLNWHILAFLFLGIFIPLAGIYWVGTGMNRGLENQDRSRILEIFRSTANHLSFNNKDFLEEYGIRLAKRIHRLAARSRSEGDFIAALASHCIPLNGGRNPFTDVIVGDQQGKMMFVAQKGKRQDSAGRQLLFRMLARRHFGAGDQTETLLGDVVLEDAKRFTGGQGDFFNLPPLGLLSLAQTGRSQSGILPLPCQGWQRPLFLLVEIDSRRLIQAYLEHEMKAGMLAALRRSSRGQFHFGFFSIYRTTPSISEKTLNAFLNVHTYHNVPGEITGTLVKNGETFVYYLNPRETFSPFRFLAVCGNRQIERDARLREQLLRSGFVSVLILALVMGSILSRRMLGPVAILDQGLERIRTGDLQTTLPELGTDEIGALGLNVNHFVKELRERERMQAYMSESVLEAIQHPPSVGEIDARSREVTILISDIRGFTTLSERHSPQEMFAMLNDYFESVEPILRRFGGQVQKFIGDAVYAVFPEDGRGGALGAVQAAREMMGFLAEFNRRRQDGHLFPIEIGIGISTGRVLFGKLGSEARMDYAFVGLEVDQASRLESSSKAGRHTRIILAQHTLDLISDMVQTERLSNPGARDDQQPVGHEIIAWVSPES